MNWLVAALVRHVARLVQLRGRSDTWFELSEYELVGALSTIYSGLGYDVFPEWKVGGRRVDLRAVSPRARKDDPDYLVEAKFIWEGDQRFNADRFHEERELLQDFAPIALERGEHARHLVIWLFQSRDRALPTADPRARSLRLADAITVVEREHAVLLAEPQVLDAGDLWYGSLDYRFLHLYVWEATRVADADLFTAQEMLKLIGQAPMSADVRSGFAELVEGRDPDGILERLLGFVPPRGDAYVGAGVAEAGRVSFESVLPAVQALHERWQSSRTQRAGHTGEVDLEPGES